MKKFSLAIIGLTLFVSGCKDEQLVQKLLEAEKQIVQLQSKLSSTQSELDHANQRFPSLRVEVVPLFNQTETLRFSPDPDNEYARNESEVSVFVSTANTKIEWLDEILNRSLIRHYMSDEAWEKAQHQTMSDEVLRQFFENVYQGYKRDAAEDRPIGYTTSASTHYIGQRHKLVRFIQTFEHYSGGAHGIYHNHHLNIDTEKQKLVQLADLLKPAYYDDFNALLWQKYQEYLQEDNGDPSEAFIEREDFFIPDNFYFSATGLHFIYPLYSLAPFAVGEVELAVGYAEVAKWINVEYLPAQKVERMAR